MSKKIRSNDTVLLMVITTSDISELESDKQPTSDICQFVLRDMAARFIKQHKHFSVDSR